MIDLNKLQAQIDSLLESETDESILNWYLDQKVEKYRDLLGDGVFSNLADESCSITAKGEAINLTKSSGSGQYLNDDQLVIYSSAA